MNTDELSPSKRHRRSSKLSVMLSLAVLLLLAACVFLGLRYHQLLAKQQASPTAQVQKLTRLLGATVVLPPEQPSIVTVIDKSKLGDPQLVQEAHNGDQLVIYGKAKRVILYRPSSKKVIDMFHVDTAKSAVPSAATEPTD